jgi:hypothetical protein
MSPFYEMPAALPITLRVRALLAARGLSVSDMSVAIKRTESTIKNVLTGNARTRSDRTRQLISDYVGDEIFPGVKPRLERLSAGVKLQRGTELLLPTAEAAGVLKSLLGSSAERRKRTLILTQLVVVHIPILKNKSSTGESPTL